jgi:multidrug resistance efflux pump
LFEKNAGRGFDVEQRQAEADQLKAQLENAKWNLDKTTVRAPADGYVTNVALRKGARYARYVRPGQVVEVTFKFMPGQIYAGKVETVLQAIATGQVAASGAAAAPKAIQAAPFVARVALDDALFARALPAGSVGEAAIYTDHLKVTHVVRKVLLRQTAILNYVNLF